MASSRAATVEEYLEGLPADRRVAITELRTAITQRLPEGYEESMRWGMITYEVPLRVHPDTYNGEPLMYAAIASQKRHMAVYLSNVYADPARLERFREAYLATGKKLDMGKSCVRFTRLENLPVNVVVDEIA